jgi:hypothetical protein
MESTASFITSRFRRSAQVRTGVDANRPRKWAGFVQTDRAVLAPGGVTSERLLSLDESTAGPPRKNKTLDRLRSIAHSSVVRMVKRLVRRVTFG